MFRIFGSRSGTNEAVNKFSAQYFNQLYQTLSQQLSRSVLQSDVVVHSLKDLGEVMVWAGKDKGVEPDPVKSRITEMFGELPIMKTIVSVHKMAYGTAPEIQQQVLQTLSIILLNLAHDGSVPLANGSQPDSDTAPVAEVKHSPTNSSFYFLLSNGYINELMRAPFDDSDEEVLGYYISLMKTLSVAFNESTLNFFFTRQIARRGAEQASDVQEQVGGVDFPMYARAVAYADHDEGMVRAAVRTISLNVYRLGDPTMHAYILQHPQGAYPTIVAKRIQRLLLDANDLAVRYADLCSGSARHNMYTCSASVFPGCIQVRQKAAALAEQAAAGGSSTNGRRGSIGRSSATRLASDLSNACADIGDELYYLQDVLALDDPQKNPAFHTMAQKFQDAFLRIVVRPLLLGCPSTSHPLEQSDHGVEPLEPSLRLHMLAEVLRVITHQAFQRSVLAYLCKTIVPTFTQLDELIGPCIEDGSPSIFLALAQLLIVLQQSMVAAHAHQRQQSPPDKPAAVDDTGLHISGSNGKPKLRLRSGSGAGSPRHEPLPDTRPDSLRLTEVSGLGATMSRWSVLLASLSLPGPFTRASRAAAVILTRLQTTGFGSCVTGPGILCLAQAVSALGSHAHDALMRAREEDPIQAIGLLASCETLAFESIGSSDILPAAAQSYVEELKGQGMAWTRPLSRGPTPTPAAGATATGPPGPEVDDSAAQAYEMVTSLSASASSKDWHRLCNCWAVDVAEMCVSMAAEPLSPIHLGDTDEQDSDASVEVEDRPLVWYDPYMLLALQDDGEGTSWSTPYASFQDVCRQYCRLRSLLACLTTPGPLPLLRLARGLSFTALQAVYHDQAQVVDDLACNAFLLDEPLRSVAPPVDSIRPGNVFTLTAFQYYTAALYPTPTGTLSAPIAKGLPLAISRDPLAPLSASVGSQRRVAVVLGQSYLVVAVVLSQKQSGQSNAPAAAAGAAPRVRGRAIMVTPLHCTFVTPLPDAPTIVDVRVMSTSEAIKGVCMDLGPWLPRSSTGSGAASHALLRMQGFSLAFDAVEGPSKTVQHVEAARARVLLEKVEHLHALRKVEFRLNRIKGQEEADDSEDDGPQAPTQHALPLPPQARAEAEPAHPAAQTTAEATQE